MARTASLACQAVRTSPWGSIAGFEEATEPGSTAVADAFAGGGEPPAYPIQRVSFAASVSEGVVLDPLSDFVESLVCQADHMERISDLSSLGQQL